MCKVRYTITPWGLESLPPMQTTVDVGSESEIFDEVAHKVLSTCLALVGDDLTIDKVDTK